MARPGLEAWVGQWLQEPVKAIVKASRTVGLELCTIRPLSQHTPDRLNSKIFRLIHKYRAD